MSHSTPNLHQFTQSLEEKAVSRIGLIGCKDGSQLKDFSYYQAQFQSANVKQLLKELKAQIVIFTKARLKQPHQISKRNKTQPLAH